MKHTLIAAIAVLFTLTLKAQAPLCTWLDGTTSSSTNNLQLDYGNGAMKTDAQGNVYFVGEFSFGNFSVGAYTDTNSTAHTYFYYGKINPSGSVAWLKEITNTGLAYVRTIAVNSKGHFVIAGTYSGDIAFDPTHQLVNNGYSQFFLAGFDSSGEISSYGSPGGATNSVSDISGLYLDDNNNTYCTGYFGGTLEYDTTLTTTYTAVFTAKFDHSGNQQWFRTADGLDNYAYPTGSNIIVSGNDVYVVGYTSDSIKFPQNNTVIKSKGQQDIFMAKYTTGGHLEWAKYMGGGALNDFVYGIGVDGQSRPCFDGVLGNGNGHFGSDSTNGDGSSQSGYIVKCDSSGTILWVDYATTNNGLSYLNDLACDSAGNVFAVGTFGQNQLIVGGTSQSEITVDSIQGGLDAFALAFDANGKWLWAKPFATVSIETGDQIALKNGILTVAGSFSKALYVDGFDIVDTNQNSNQIFFAQMPETATGIEQLSVNNNQLSIYPNPSSGMVTISSLKKIDEVRVTNLLGQTVLKSPLGNLGVTHYDFELKNEGLYFVTITSGNETETKKIIIAK